MVARDVTSAMLDGKSNNLSLCWELNFIIMQICEKKLIIVLHYHPTWLLCHVAANQELLVFIGCNSGLVVDPN